MKKEALAKMLKGANQFSNIKLYIRKCGHGSKHVLWMRNNGKFESLGLPGFFLSPDNTATPQEISFFRKAIARRDEIEKGKHIASKSMRKAKVSEVMDEWINHYSIYETRNNAKQAKKTFIMANSDIMASSVSRSHLVKLIDFMKQNGEGSNRIRFIASRIRTFANWAEQRGYMERVDTRQLLPPYIYGEVKILTEEELKRLAATPCDCPDAKDLFMLGIYTAQRIGEIKQYTFALLRDGQIRARQGKTGKFIVIPLLDDAMSIIEGLKRRRAGEGMGVADNDKVFRLPCAQVLRREFRKWLEAANIPKDKVTLRNCRSTAISLLINKGVSISVAQELANHADIQTTARYYRQIDDSQKREALAKIKLA